MKTMYLSLLACLLLMVPNLQAQDIEPVTTREYNEWYNGMMPGAGYMVFMPNGRDSLGIFQGATAFFDFFSMSEEAYYKGPAHMRFYGRLGILNSTDAQSSGKMFMYSVGSAFSFESKIPRWFMVPYFGLEMGGMHQPDFRGAFHITPIGGLNLVHTERVTWFVQGGYTYNTRKFQDWSGINLSTGISVSFW